MNVHITYRTEGVCTIQYSTSSQQFADVWRVGELQTRMLQALLSFLTCSHFLRKHILTGLWLNRRMFSIIMHGSATLPTSATHSLPCELHVIARQLHWGAASGRTTHSSVGNLRVSETDRQTKKSPNNLPFC
jgi:hypothetical protein